MTDYPAAHSTDSTWFAVDEDGQIAAFDTDEEGQIPRGFPSEGLPYDSLLIARLLMLRAETDDRLRELLPKSLGKLVHALDDGDASEIFVALMRSLGVWVYEFNGWIYARSGGVPNPIYFKDLDRGSQQWLRKARLPLRFHGAPVFAPGEHVESTASERPWWDWQGRAHGEEIDGEPEELTGLDKERHEELKAETEAWLAEAEKQPVIPEDRIYEVVKELLTGTWIDRPDWWKDYAY